MLDMLGIKKTRTYYPRLLHGPEQMRVVNQRDLGVLITCDARFSEHIFAQVNKANKMLGFMRRTINRSDQLLPTLRYLYVVLVRSHLDYASEIWSPKSVTLIKLIERDQRRATADSPARAKLQLAP